MGVGFSAVALAILATPVLYLFVWLFRVFSKANKSGQNSFVAKFVRESSLLLGLFASAFILFIILSFRNEGSFEKYPGSGDYWRIPLKKPFQLSMIDGLDHACLSVWEPNQTGFSCMIDGITRGAVIGTFLIGEAERGFFLFNQADSSLVSTSTLDSLEIKLTEMGVRKVEELKTVRIMYNEYWETN